MSTEIKEWTPEQLRYLMWLALPKAERQPKTQRALAAELDLSEETLSRWKMLPGFIEAVNTLARELVKHDVPEVLGTIRTMAKAGSVPHLNMFLSMAGLAGDVEAAGKGPPGVDDARERLYNRLARHLDKADA